MHPETLLDIRSPLLDELPIGLVRLRADGESLQPNARGQRIRSLVGEERLDELLRSMTLAAGERATLQERRLDLGPAGELRVLVEAAGDGYMAVLELSAVSRLKAESRALRSLLAAAADVSLPRDAASRVFAILSSALSGASMALYEADQLEGVLLCTAEYHPRALRQTPFQRLPLDPLSSSIGQAIGSNRPVHVPRLSRSPFPRERALPGADELALLALPLSTSGAPSAAVVCSPQGSLGEREIRLIQGLADALGALLQRVRQAAEIEAEREALRSLLAQLPDAVVELSPAGVVLLAEGSVEAVLGGRPDDLLGGSIEDRVEPAEIPQLHALLDRAVEEDARGTFEITGLDGVKRRCEVSARPMPGRARLRCIVRALPTRDVLTADPRSARTVDLQREKLAAIGTLAGGVAHEINNPLSFVRSNIVSMGRYLEELKGHVQLDDDLREMLADADSIVAESLTGVDRIVSIIRAMKGLVRGGAPGESAPFDPTQAVSDAVTVFRGARRAECAIELEVPAALPQVRGAPGSLGQIVLNLLENALDAMGGRGNIRVSLEHAGELVRVHVADEGPGIPEAVAAQIFDPFFTTKPVGKGTGLGLYICYELAQQMGGKITFDTGKTGTTFHVDLRVVTD